MGALPLSETTTEVTAADDAILISVTGELACTAERVLAAVVDFSERRERVFPAVSMRRLTLHSLGTTTADVTEGTRAGPFVFWERCTYDWSQPGQVSALVTDSNIYAFPGSLWELTATSTAAGSRVVMTWTRRFQKRPLGRFMGFVYRHDGKRAFTKYARQILANLVQDHDDARQ
jgi:Polyketide cyclase / dehydrase and lipid transport